MRSLWILICVSVLAGCAVYYDKLLDERFGAADPARYDRPAPAHATLDYWRDVKPVLDNRCVVCHGCYDAPCQANLASYQGVTRGARKDLPYDGARLIATEPTRMFFDAQSSAAWRRKGFNPILNERAAMPEADREGSVLYRLLKLKRVHGMPKGAILPKDRFDFTLDRTQQCPAIEDIESFEQKYPDWGMPFGLPALSDREYGVLTSWIEAGAPYRDPPPLPATYVKRIAEWERFLNGDSLKARLMSRYIYEHWFIGHLYFDDLPGQEYFQLVRSKTPPGEPIEVIATVRPFDHPGVDRVYYRLRRTQETPIAKTLMPYALNAARMARFKAWFLNPPYEVAALPSYAPEVASNPFITFGQLPINARYRFLLEDAQFTMMGFIKGPVCRGQVALNVINDHFWVVFVNPDVHPDESEGEFLASQVKNLRLPAEHESTTRLLRFRTYAALNADYLKAKSEYLYKRVGEGILPPTLESLWNGDGGNPTAALTVFRHFDSATVVQGLVGERPQTVLVLGYALFERIHYLLVAGFDVYGNAGHQLATRLYFDFMRMEGELNFLAFLPRAVRQATRDHWYRGASPEHSEHLNKVNVYFPGNTGIRFTSQDPLAEMYAMMKRHLAPIAQDRYVLARSGLSGAPLRSLEALSRLRGRSISYFPESAFLTVRGAGGTDYHFTVLSNSAHSNVAELFGDEKRRLPDEDTLSVMNGFVGAYPNAFFRVNAGDLPGFVDAMQGLASESDYQKLLTRYGIRRTDPRFWAHSDALLAAYRRWAPREAGLFDYNRFENR
ncbi:MAG TPA: fatty acid cis/trans isomerase [Burkholderiales bacterium]|nr:fatty acid cis/trans isomerase [Burkholderiales bacterium]